MKKILALALSFTMLAATLAGCGNKNKPPEVPPETMPDTSTPGTSESTTGSVGDTLGGMAIVAGTKMEDIVMKLGEDLGISMPEKLDEKTLKDIMGINEDDVEEYYGEYSTVNTSSDHIIGVKVKEGKIDTVKKALEERKATVVKNFEQYLPDQLEKAKSGKIVERGNYLFLVIAGDTTKGMDKEIKRAEEIIDSYFQK